MGVVAGLLLGAGLCLVMWAATSEPTTDRRPARWQQHLGDLLVQAGAPQVTPLALVGACAATGGVVFVLAAALTGSPPIAAPFAAMAGYAPLALVRARARRRRAALRALWPDVVDHLVSGIRAGLSLPEALAQVGERGPEQLREPFAAFAADYRVTGRFAECLDALKARLADPVADRIVESLRLTRDVGGTDLGRQLRTLSAFLRADERTRGELEARQSWTVAGARVAVAAPWVVLAMLATRPEATAAYDSPIGALVLGGGALSSVVAYQLMLRLGRLPEDARVLR
ncbi:type II secretion system F family protein [Actinotalea sp. M2MS4P-6]|uniref:type II secretion system F family protein n=1 Tax=Actinotalea sp. M2MS4P-6 TaxID=2983762 RepID=UPI0021E415D9|nr:type II secretion system F family protein [Actinotalea sp. M2MS4P-6]MCV2393750.1 type II secretion system F family protein [Actinotalea sp. M2MS4P-6]